MQKKKTIPERSKFAENDSIDEQVVEFPSIDVLVLFLENILSNVREICF